MPYNKHILFTVPYPVGKAPSQRFRFEQYFSLLAENGFTYEVAPFIDGKTWQILYKPGHTKEKVGGILTGFWRRFILLFTLGKYAYIFIHREATPIGPPWFEWVATRLLNKKVIYDFDDAIWIPNTSDNNKIVAGIKWHHKVSSICKWAYKVSCGNAYLQKYAQKYNINAIINPTTIDTIHHHNFIKNQETPEITIGWTGTHSTLKYLEPVIPILKHLEERYTFTFTVISNQAPNFDLKSLKFIPWCKETEIQDLSSFNIGLMPLEDDPWANGKCAFKALQYMALGVPAVVSPVGMNKEVVTDGINGYICATPSDWYTAIEKLISDHNLRITLGIAARITIETRYAVISNSLNFLNLFS